MSAYDPGTDEHRAGRPSPPIAANRQEREAQKVEWREPDPWPIIEWLQENMPRALELCPYKVKR